MLCNQIKPNAFACLDFFIFLAEGGFSIYVFVVVADEKKNNCNSQSGVMWAAMVICLINGIIMIVKLILHAICFCAFAILLSTKMINF